MWYCPRLSHEALSATFLDVDVFSVLRVRPLTQHLHTYNTITKMLPRYRWALRDWGRLPTAYTLPKAKKPYAKAKPIVSFVGATSQTSSPKTPCAHVVGAQALTGSLYGYFKA